MMETDDLQYLVVEALGDLKANDIQVIDVRNKTTITDAMIIASGTSDRHVKALADSVVAKAKQAGMRPLGVEGEHEGEWVLVDLNDIVVHVMLPRVRDFYNLERLWGMEERLDVSSRS
jgi:ribosome-associated protein